LTTSHVIGEIQGLQTSRLGSGAKISKVSGSEAWNGLH
jgi:hypothetical protein